MDTSKAANNDGQTTQVAGFQSSVLTGRTLSIVVVTNDNPLDALVAVLLRNSRDALPFTGKLVLDLVGLAVGNVNGADEAVLGDVLEMATILEPWSTSRDVIGG